MNSADAKKPGPEAETLHIEGPWEAAIDKALSKKRPIGGFPKPPTRTVRPKRIPPPTKPAKAPRNRTAVERTDPIDMAEAKVRMTGGKASKADIQAEMLRANCTRDKAIANLKARAKKGS